MILHRKSIFKKWKHFTRNRYSTVSNLWFSEKVLLNNIASLLRKFQMTLRNNFFSLWVSTQLSSNSDRISNTVQLRQQRRLVIWEWCKWQQRSERSKDLSKTVHKNKLNFNISSLRQKDKWYAKILELVNCCSNCYISWKWTWERTFFQINTTKDKNSWSYTKLFMMLTDNLSVKICFSRCMYQNGLNLFLKTWLQMMFLVNYQW